MGKHAAAAAAAASRFRLRQINDQFGGISFIVAAFRYFVRIKIRSYSTTKYFVPTEHDDNERSEKKL